jgi:hypothetical protein
MVLAYHRTANHLASLWASHPLWAGQHDHLSAQNIMALDPARSEIFDQLEDELRLAPALVPTMFAKVISGACRRPPNVSRGVARLDRLIAVGAWSDAALVLIELELPAWRLRRLIREDNEWFCSLSRQPNLPMTLDVTADAHHDSLPLAILLAFLQARRTAETAPGAISVTPHVRPEPHSIICCDNFA